MQQQLENLILEKNGLSQRIKAEVKIEIKVEIKVKIEIKIKAEIRSVRHGCRSANNPILVIERSRNHHKVKTKLIKLTNKKFKHNCYTIKKRAPNSGEPFFIISI